MPGLEISKPNRPPRHPSGRRIPLPSPKGRRPHRGMPPGRANLGRPFVNIALWFAAQVFGQSVDSVFHPWLATVTGLGLDAVKLDSLDFLPVVASPLPCVWGKPDPHDTQPTSYFWHRRRPARITSNGAPGQVRPDSHVSPTPSPIPLSSSCVPAHAP